MRFWFKTTVYQRAEIIAKYQSVPPRGGFHITIGNTGDVAFSGRDRNGYRSSGPAGVDVTDGNWHHLVGMRDGSVWSIWVDGALKNSTDVADTSAMDNPISLVIGCAIDVTGIAGYFNGAIDEVRILNRSLSAEEIKEDYESTAIITKVTISTDKTTYTTGDIMGVEINISNPSDTSKSVVFGWWLTIPSFDYMTVPIATIPMTLPAGYNQTFIFPINVGYWGEKSFGAVWGVALSDPKTNEIISFDATYWNYKPTRAVKVEKSPVSIAKEIKEEIERVELPS